MSVNEPPSLPFPDFTAIVLDGGKATRLGGAHKAFLAVGGRPIAERSVDVLRALFPAIVAATSRPDAWSALGVRCVADPVKDAGPLAGLAAGLASCSTPFAFVVAGDMPALSRDVIAAVCERARASRTCAVPRLSGRAEPLHAAYPTALAPLALGAVRGGTRKLTDFLSTVPVAWLDEAELAGLPGFEGAFRNVNTPEDLAGSG